MSSLEKDLLFLILQFLDKKNLTRTAHKLEQESGIFFSMPYFEDRVINGDWDEVENYLSGFTMPDDNTISRDIFYAIREHKYLDALDREDEEVSKNRDLINARGEMLSHVKKLIEENPVFRDKLVFPTFDPSTLGTLSLNLQHHLAAFLPSQSIELVPSPLPDAVPKPVESTPPFQDPGSSEMSNESPLISTFDDVSATTGSSTGDQVSPETSAVSMNGEPRTADGSSVKSRLQKLIYVNKPSECRFQRLPDSLVELKVRRLTYTNSGSTILALYVNGVHKLWKWLENDSNSMGKFPTNSICFRTATSMINDTSGMNPVDADPCFALSNNDSYIMSASGGEISYFNTHTFQREKSFMYPSFTVTFMAFHPQNNDIIAIGMDDSSIQIYDFNVGEVKTMLKAHQKRITGLAFSNILNVLVSSGADSQLCVWSTDTWEKQTNEYLRSPDGRSGASLTDTLVQFHQDQKDLLAVQETQIVIYEAEAANLNWRAKVKWALEANVPITYATYSCDSKSIYVTFKCGSIRVLTAASLRSRCRIDPSLYLPANSSLQAYPLVIAAHPSNPNQFALGLSDGGVYVLEPPESEGKWYL